MLAWVPNTTLLLLELLFLGKYFTSFNSSNMLLNNNYYTIPLTRTKTINKNLLMSMF